MRPTVSLDYQLAKQVRRATEARGISCRAFTVKTLDDASKRSMLPGSPPLQLVTSRGVHPRPGADLDRPRALDTQEAKARYRDCSPRIWQLHSDVIVLIYAHFEDLHIRTPRICNAGQSSDDRPEPSALSTLVQSAFVRVVTNPRVFGHPSTLDRPS